MGPGTLPSSTDHSLKVVLSTGHFSNVLRRPCAESAHSEGVLLTSDKTANATETMGNQIASIPPWYKDMNPNTKQPSEHQ